MSVEIAWKQNILVTDFQLLKSLLVVLGFGSQVFICGFNRQNICSVYKAITSKLYSAVGLQWKLYVFAVYDKTTYCSADQSYSRGISIICPLFSDWQTRPTGIAQ